MKKKLLAVLLTCTLAVPAFAATPDISGLTIDELVEYRTEIDAAIYENGGYVELPEQTYVVGVDILAGDYNIRAIEHMSMGNEILVFADEEQIETYNAMPKTNYREYSLAQQTIKFGTEHIETDHDVLVRLEDGNILRTTGHTMLIAKAEKLPFAP